MGLRLNADGEVEIRESFEFTPKPRHRSVSFSDVGEAFVDQKADYEQRRAEYKQRVARNGNCPHDGKPCWKYKVCVLEKAETCGYYKKSKKLNNTTLSCSSCRYLPKDGNPASCELFWCMVAGNNRVRK